MKSVLGQFWTSFLNEMKFFAQWNNSSIINSDRFISNRITSSIVNIVKLSEPNVLFDIKTLILCSNGIEKFSREKCIFSFDVIYLCVVIRNEEYPERCVSFDGAAILWFTQLRYYQQCAQYIREIMQMRVFRLLSSIWDKRQKHSLLLKTMAPEHNLNWMTHRNVKFNSFWSKDCIKIVFLIFRLEIFFDSNVGHAPNKILS